MHDLIAFNLDTKKEYAAQDWVFEKPAGCLLCDRAFKPLFPDNLILLFVDDITLAYEAATDACRDVHYVSLWKLCWPEEDMNALKTGVEGRQLL